MAQQLGFRFGDVFDADAPVDQWLIGLSMGLNDVVSANVRLMESLEGDAPPHERLFLARLVGAQVWEIAKLVQAGGKDPVVGRFVTGLPAEARTEYDAIIGLFADDGFKAALGRARDYFKHYPEIGRKELRAAMDAVGDELTGALIGKNLAATRLDYADVVAANLFFRRPSERREEFAAFIAKLSGQVVHITSFVQMALWEKLKQHRDVMQVTEVADG